MRVRKERQVLKVSFFNLAFGVVLVFTWSLPVNAQIYKWVDENGKVHYTDRKPVGNEESAQTVDVDSHVGISDTSMPRVEKQTPIKNSKKELSKLIVLEHFSFKFNSSGEGGNAELGQSYIYVSQEKRRLYGFNRVGKSVDSALTCNPKGKLKSQHAEFIGSKSNFAKVAQETIENLGYKSVNTETKFALQQAVGAEISLSAEVVDTRLSICDSGRDNNLNQYTQNSTYLKIHWEVFDNLRRKVVYEYDTEGVDDHIRRPPRLRGGPKSMELAFQQALEGLFSSQEFVDVLLDNQRNQKREVASVPSIDVELIYGDDSSSFTKKIPKIRSATATVRTVSGHGSGFVISTHGHVLTNQHVVANNKDILVIIDGVEYTANVLKVDVRRDVALLKITDDFNNPPVEIDANSAEWGEQIYVIGTPLDEALDFSISRGIISSHREIDNKPYYQTDAAVNPGNSGGPVFNDEGNVIGITVSGYITKDGGSRNINNIIPIDDALRVLGL